MRMGRLFGVTRVAWESIEFAGSPPNFIHLRVAGVTEGVRAA
jgi:hypothetical protein